MAGLKGIQNGISFTRAALANPERINNLGGIKRIPRGGKINGLFSEKIPPSYPLPKGVRAELARV